MCAGMMRGRKGMFERATKVANWTLTHQLGIIYFIFLNLIWRTVGLKLNPFLFYGFLVIIILFVWYGLSKFIYNKLTQVLQEIDQNGYMPKQIRKWGMMGATLMFLAPLILFIIGIFTISNYRDW